MSSDYNNTTVDPISRMTIASLADLGYQVDYSKADSFRKEDLDPSCTCNNSTGRRTLEDNAMAGPAATVDTVPRRHLSSTGRQQAITYGKTILAANKPPSSFVLRDGLYQQDDVVYIGDQVVSVFVMENGSIFDVVVTADN
jgi:hypothetical protein